MKTVLYSFLLIFPCLLSAQNKQDYNWMFGSGIIGDLDSNYILSFNNEILATEIIDAPMYLYTANTSMSDSIGNLLFYTNNCYIANKEHEIMENGDELNLDYLYENRCGEGIGNPTVQGAMILPFPNNENLYCLFTLGGNYVYNPDDFTGYRFVDKINYALIDMTFNNGLGKVVEKNIPLVVDTMEYGQLNAVRHANNQDWWIVNTLRNTPGFVTLLLTEDGIEGPFYQMIGDTIPLFEHGISQSVFSPDGTKYAIYEQIHQGHFYNFDRETGLMSNYLRLQAIEPTDTSLFAGVAFSSNSRFLYTSSYTKLYQFDTDAEDIQGSKELIAEFEEIDEFLPSYFWRMQLGPDCRIYMNSTNGVHNLHVIDKPNEKGEACEFYQRGIQLPYSNSISLPHFPHYRLGTNSPICDESIDAPIVIVSSVGNIVEKQEKKIKLYPNPTQEMLNIEIGGAESRTFNIEIYSLLGQRMKSEKLFGKHLEISVRDLPLGLYFCKIFQNKELIQTTSFVKQ